MLNTRVNKILICGLYFSGSGALIDLLSEYNSVAVVPGEFDEFRRAGMIGDHIEGRIGDDYRCKVKSTIFNFMQPLYGHSRPRLINILRYMFTMSPLRFAKKRYSQVYKRIKLIEDVKVNIANSEIREQKIVAASEWIKDIVRHYSRGKDNLVFDQPIFLKQHKGIWPQVFAPCKLVIVYRDPRDQIADLIKRNLLFSDILTPTHGLLNIYGAHRLGAIKYEIDMGLARLRSARELQSEFGTDRVMLLKFEEIVMNYDKIKEQVESFLALSSDDHVHKKIRFDPNISMRNIGIYNQILSKDELRLFDEILSFYE